MQKTIVKNYKFYFHLIGAMLFKSRDTINVFNEVERSGQSSSEDRFAFTPKEIEVDGKKVTIHIVNWQNKSIRFDALGTQNANDELVKQYLSQNNYTLDPQNDEIIRKYFSKNNFVVKPSEQIAGLIEIRPSTRAEQQAL